MTRALLLFLALAGVMGTRCSERVSTTSGQILEVANKRCSVKSPMRIGVDVDAERRVRICGAVSLPMYRVYVVNPQIIVHGDTLVVVPIVVDLGATTSAVVADALFPSEFSFYYGPLASGTKLRVTTRGGPPLPPDFVPTDTVVVVP